MRYLAWTMVLSWSRWPSVGVFALIRPGAWSVRDSTAGLILGGMLAFFLFWRSWFVSIQFSVQRLHDIGWSGWLWLLNLVPFIGSFFPLVIMVVPGNTSANRYGPPPPPNSTAVKVLCCVVDGVYRARVRRRAGGGITAIQQEYESATESSYESGSVTTEEIEVEPLRSRASTRFRRRGSRRSPAPCRLCERMNSAPRP